MIARIDWFALTVAVVVVLLVWRIAARQYPICVTCDETGLKKQRGLSLAQSRQLREFLANDVAVVGKVTILARRHANGYLELRIRGPIDMGSQQRIRNFLITLL